MTAQCHMHYFKEPVSQPARRPLEHAARAGWGHVSSEGVCVQYMHENKKYYLLLGVCVCMPSYSRGQRAEAYINHKLSGSGSCTSNEMVQIKVCLWVICVSV